MGSTDPKISQIQTNLQTLSTVASSLNTASDELTKVVGKLDEALKKLNVGLTVWVTAWSRGVEEYEYDDDQIGYDKVNGKWGIALRHLWGNHANDHHDEEGPWLFTDAPREMRIHCVSGIPELIERLTKEASDTTKKIQEKTKEVGQLAAAIESAANEAKRKSLAERVAAAKQAQTNARLVDLVRKANAGIVAVPGGKPEGGK